MKLTPWSGAMLAIVIAIAAAGLFTTREVNTAIEIDAPAEAVWQAVSDFERYGEWNPFIIAASGNPVSGSPLALTIRPAIGGEFGFDLLIGSAEPPREMVWLGRTLMPGVLDGRHHLRIEALDGGRSRFSQGERFSGLLLYFGWPIIDWSATRSFDEMNLALKQRTESTALTTPPPR